jgi:hypothetical protein
MILRAATKRVEGGVNAVPLMEERVARKIALATGGNFIVIMSIHFIICPINIIMNEDE